MDSIFHGAQGAVAKRESSSSEGSSPEAAAVSSTVQLELDCRPCSVFGQRPCKYGDYRCMTGIKPETIVEKIKQTIA